MHRVDAPGNVQGRFSDGNPAAGQQSTQAAAKWFNALQDELVNIIELANIDLDDTDNAQLAQAVIALVAGVVGDGSGAVPTTRRLLTSGLLAGGGPLAADLTLSVAKAIVADIVAGLRDDVAMTPLGLATAFAPVIGSNSYARGPGGLLIQSGRLRGFFSEGPVSVTFPVAFASPPAGAFPVAVNQSSNIQFDIHVQNVSQSATGASFFFNFDGDGSNSISGLDYIAWGK